MGQAQPAVTTLIGSTPLVRLDRLAQQTGADVWAKMERGNPGGSVKDRTAWYLIRDAEERGLITPGQSTLVEATSGNTGIALAMLAAARGYQLVLVMPEGQSLERLQLFQAFGAQVVESPREERTGGAVARAKQIEAGLPHAYMTRQHENPANPRVHEETTGPEIWAATKGRVDVVVAGVGTGGTVTGIGRYLKRQKPPVRMVAVEPEGSAVISGRPPGPHEIQGIGAGFLPKNLDLAVLDDVVAVSDQEAWDATRELAQQDGLLVGLSSGAAYAATRRRLLAEGGQGRTVVAIFPDGGDRYLSLNIFPPVPPFDRQSVPGLS